MKIHQRKQQGFTLIEIAIVLVIIGLLLGGVLKGQEIIENGKVKSAANDMNGISAAVNSYKDRYHQLPGDDNTATVANRGAGWTGVTQGNGNGVLNVTGAQTFTGAGESNAFWQQLRAANLVTGSVALAGIPALPKNAFGGLTAVTAGANGLTGNAVCMSQVPGKNAAALDNLLDDGVPNKGTMLGYLGAAGVNTNPTGGAAANYDETQVYTICRQL